ncbi:hypothetical protein L3Y34_009059 [Caenorhabditis briggsae]|uniref:Reticulon-like protein n=1 Tax=Caenorhabditis briggsae TaxID=6238 RepID=A0AAE9A7D2_CAEBR|nr:hypothetical protein L3Y34_009059 [Caenorhabditis briggsae]
MDSEIVTAQIDMEEVDVDLFFRKPPEITVFGFVKTFWIDSRDDDTHSTLKPDQTTEEHSDPEVKLLQPLALQSLETGNDESGGSSCTDSEDVRLPEEILNAPMDDDVFEDEEVIENVETDLLFRLPMNREMELVYTISKGAAINLDELEEEDEDVDVDLWFREPTDTRFELVYTIPLMEDVSVDSSGEKLEDVPPAEELDNVVEEASLTEFTFKPIGNDEETETETLTTEVVTVLERPQDDQGAGEGSRDFIEKVKLTSNDTFDSFDDEEEAFQNAFVKSVETPETPVPEYNDDQQDDVRDVSVSEVLKDAAEQLQIIHDSLSPEDVEGETLKQVELAPDFISENVGDAGAASAPDFPETRFEISPVENLKTTTPLETTQNVVQNLAMQETSDFAQLEDVPEGVPDVDRTLNALRNEDVFPKEPVPADVSKTEDIPETEIVFDSSEINKSSDGVEETQQVEVAPIGLEDGGNIETPEVLALNQSEVGDALNSEDVVGVKTELPIADGNISEDQPVLGLEECGDVEIAPVVDLKKEEIEEALNSEDVVTTSVLPVVVETKDNGSSDDGKTNEPFVGLEDPGEVGRPEIPQLNQSEVEEALNGEDVIGIKTELPSIPTETFVFAATPKTEASPSDVNQSVLGLEECGDVEAAPIGLEDGGDAETQVLPVLNQSEVKDALNSEDVVGIKTGFPVVDDVIPEDQPVKDQPVLGLEECGDEEIPPVVDLEKEEIEEALNTEDVVTTSTSVIPEVVETIVGGPSDDGKADQPVVALEESGEVETPEIPRLTKLEVEDALNSEDVVGIKTEIPTIPAEIFEARPSDENQSVLDLEKCGDVEAAPIGLEDGGDAETQVLPVLNQSEVKDALNSEDVVGIKTGSLVADDVISEDQPVKDQPAFGLEECGDVEIAPVVDLEKEEIQEALNTEDVVTTSTSVIPEVVETIVGGPSDDGKADQPVVALEESGEVETPEIPRLKQSEVEDALNSEDVAGTTTELSATEGIVAEIEKTENPSCVATKLEQVVVGLEDAGDEMPDLKKEEVADSLPILLSEETTQESEVAEVSQKELNDALNSEDVVGIKTVVVDTAADDPVPTSEVTSETPVATDGLPEEVVYNELPPEVEESVTDSQTVEEDVQEKTNEGTPPSTSAQAPSKNEKYAEESLMEKLVSIVENVLPTDAALPSEGVLHVNSESQGEEETEEPPTQQADAKKNVGDSPHQESENATSEPSSILDKLTSMMESVIPYGHINSESQAHEKELTEEPSTDAKENVAETQESETAPSESLSILDKLTSIMENVIPSENVGSESEDQGPPSQLSKDVADTPRQESETAEPSSILDKLTSMVESVLPVDSVILSEYVNQYEELRNSKSFQDLPTEEESDQTVNENAATENQEYPADPTLSEDVASKEVETPPVDEKPEKEIDNESVLEKLASVVEDAFPDVLPSEDVLSEDHIEHLKDSATPVEDVLPVNLTHHSENDASEEPGIPEEAVSVEESDNGMNSETTKQESVVESLISAVKNVVLPSEDVLSEDHVDDRDQDSETPAQPASMMEKLSSMVENVLPTALVNKTEEEVSEQQETLLVENTDDPEIVESESIVKKVVSMVESTLPAEALLPSEDVLSEDHLDGREEEPEAPTSIVEKIAEMVETVIPANSEVSSDTDIKPTEDVDTEEPKETIFGKLVSMVEDVLPVHEPLDETQQHLNTENQNPSTVETLISTSDIIPPVERVGPFETEFDAEGFVAESTDPPQSEENTIIETADIIMPVDQENQLETSFDAEDFVHESIEEPVVEAKVETEQSENAEEQTTVMGELVAMAVDILPIDGEVQESEDEEKQKHPEGDSEKRTVEEPVVETTVEEIEKETPSLVGELVAMAVDILPIDGALNIAAEVTEGQVPESSESQEDKRFQHLEESKDDMSDQGTLQVATVEVETESQHVAVPETEEESAAKLENVSNEIQNEEEPVTKTTVALQESPDPHKTTDHDYGNDYVPFGTETPSKVEFNNPEESKDEEEDFVAELNFHPIRQWKDEDVISLQSLKSLVAEVGCTTDVESVPDQENQESTLKILKVVPSEPSLMELDISNDPSVIHVPIPLMEPATKYLEEMVEWIIADAIKEVSEVEVVTESELSEMVPQESENECPVPEPLADLKLPFEDEEKTPEPEQINEEVPVKRDIPVESEPTQMIPIPQRPPRAPKVESAKPIEQPKSPKNRFGPLNIKLGRSYSEEQQKELVESLERPLTVITSSEPKPSEKGDVDALSPLSPNTLEEYEHVPMMDMQSVPHSPQEKQDDTVHVVTVTTDATPSEEKEEAKINTVLAETKILGPGKSMEYVANEEEDGSECLDSIGDLSERTIQRFNTSIDDPSIRRDSFSSISSFGDRQKFRTAIENIRQDLLPFQSSVSQFLDPSVKELLVTNLSMDSPSDLSPNAPPVGFENTAQYLEKLQQQQQQEDRPSAEGSIDSSGFEKVDHESLDDYGTSVEDPMQKSVFGSLTAEDDMMSSHHDDVIEKNYFGDDAATAKLLESPIAEEARKLVQDAVESASEYKKHAVEEGDEIGRELLDNVQQKVEQVKEPVEDALHKAYDGMGDFVHETVPQAVDDFIHEVEKKLPESPLPEKVETPEPLVDIHDTVDQVHDEIDNYLRREPTPPIVEEDENAPVDDKPHFGNQTPEEDETTFDRKGPLTIPEEVERAAAVHQHVEDLDDFDPLVTANTGAAFGAAVGAAASEALTEEEMFGHQKFETVPRPPTPPKDISDEDVKPSTVNLGPAHHHSHPSSPHHSILKHHGEAWIDFKTVPPCETPTGTEEQAAAMSKLGAIGRGLYALIAFVVNIVLKVGLHAALVAGVGISAHEAYKLTKSSGVLQRKEESAVTVFYVAVGGLKTAKVTKECKDSGGTDNTLAEIVFVARRASDADRLPITVTAERQGGDKYAAVRLPVTFLVAIYSAFAVASSVTRSIVFVVTLVLSASSYSKMAQTRFVNKKYSKQPTWVPATDFFGKILDVIYWRDAKKSAIVLSLALLALFILAKYPLLTVITYSLLLALGAAAGFRAYKKIESQIKKTDAENPFSEILANDLSLPQEKVHAQADVFTEHATCIANKLKKLILVESPLESIKFGLILWSLTYVASWFSGCTLAVLALLGTFSIPKVYEANQEAIDPHLATVSGHLKNVQNLIDEKLPFLRSAPVAAEEKKDQ